mmetsp:Transcript_95665/g.308825  ORF Transcript_95665/g.308825 Transcript_95665/m.308825 type:complete len:213 (+) Transcript_95665:541-1179(+)
MGHFDLLAFARLVLLHEVGSRQLPDPCRQEAPCGLVRAVLVGFSRHVGAVPGQEDLDALLLRLVEAALKLLGRAFHVGHELVRARGQSLHARRRDLRRELWPADLREVVALGLDSGGNRGSRRARVDGVEVGQQEGVLRLPRLGSLVRRGRLLEERDAGKLPSHGLDQLLGLLRLREVERTRASRQAQYDHQPARHVPVARSAGVPEGFGRQ